MRISGAELFFPGVRISGAELFFPGVKIFWLEPSFPEAEISDFCFICIHRLFVAAAAVSDLFRRTDEKLPALYIIQEFPACLAWHQGMAGILFAVSMSRKTKNMYESGGKLVKRGDVW